MPDSYDLHLYAGDDTAIPLMFTEDGGRGIDDLLLTSGSNIATSATAAFTQSDRGARIVTEEGDGITDSCTVSTVTNATTITLSQNASATGSFTAAIRARDCSGWSAHLAQVRASTNDTDDPVLVTADWDTTRDDVGVLLIIFDADTTRTLGDGLIGTTEQQVGVYDAEAVDENGELHTRVAGAVFVTPDVSRAP